MFFWAPKNPCVFVPVLCQFVSGRLSKTFYMLMKLHNWDLYKVPQLLLFSKGVKFLVKHAPNQTPPPPTHCPRKGCVTELKWKITLFYRPINLKESPGKKTVKGSDHRSSEKRHGSPYSPAWLSGDGLLYRAFCTT